MAQFNAQDLILLAIKTAASAAGGRIGSLVGNEVLTVLGLKQADLADVTARLDTIDADITLLKQEVAALADTTSWTAINSDLTKYQQAFETGYADIAAILNNGAIDQGVRDTRLTAKLCSFDVNRLEADLAALGAFIAGSSSGITRQDSFPKLFLAKFWNEFHGAAVTDDFVIAAGRIMNLLTLLVDLQRKGALLVWNCNMAGAVPQPDDGARVMTENATSLAAQYKAFMAASPDLMALHNMVPKVGETVSVKSAVAGLASPFLSAFGPIYFSGQIPFSAMDSVPVSNGFTLGYLPDQTDLAWFRFIRMQGASWNANLSAADDTALVSIYHPPGHGRSIVPPTPIRQTRTVTLLTTNPGKDVRFRLIPTATPNDYLLHTDDGRALVLGDEGLTGQVPQLVAAGSGGTGPEATWTIRTTRSFDALYSGYSQI